ncbi:MAG: hypothetical protein KDD64_03640 [Bdellovibrionales bacterium]|nr:hypothetical protein [Bdellovibrionales bacterium]
MKRSHVYLLAAFAVLIPFSLAQARNGDVKICGTLESIDASQITLNGISYPLDGDVEFESEQSTPIPLSEFSPGELVELRIRDGRVDQVEKESEQHCGGGGGSGSSSGSDDNGSGGGNSDDSGKGERERFCGTITALSESSISIGSRAFLVSSSTEFESRSGTRLSISAFSIGDVVKVDVRNGVLHEVEYDSSSGCRSKNSVTSISQSPTIRRMRLKTRLQPSSGATFDAYGSGRYESRAKKGKARDRLTLKVKVLPSGSDLSSSSSLQLAAYLQRGNETLAVCELIRDNSSDQVAEYKVDLRERSGSFSAKKGSCDVDLAQLGIQNAIPPLRKGDTITVVPADLSSLVEGQF